MDEIGTHELRAVLAAYKLVMDASWPDLHATMAERSHRWAAAGEAVLRAELAEYVREASEPRCRVRVFWKLGPEFRLAGCNDHFAADAGLPAADLIGLDDFDRRLPWVHQAAKYRADDEGVYREGTPKLDILERQKGAGGLTWVRAGKAPIRVATGAVIGVLGMYELLDGEAGRKLFAERVRGEQTSDRTTPARAPRRDPPQT